MYGQDQVREIREEHVQIATRLAQVMGEQLYWAEVHTQAEASGNVSEYLRQRHRTFNLLRQYETLWFRHKPIVCTEIPDRIRTNKPDTRPLEWTTGGEKMTPPVKVQLTHEERQALEALAVRNFRRPSDELRRLLQDELRRSSLDPPDPPRNETRDSAKVVETRAQSLLSSRNQSH